MADIQENMAVANEISEAISNPMGTGLEIDDVRPLYLILHVFTHKNHLDFQQAELKAELEELEQEQLDERLIGADHVPLHHPGGTVRERKSSFQYHSFPKPQTYVTNDVLLWTAARPVVTAEDDEEQQLKELQAALAM